ncbi:MAG: hypothetical protein IKN82_08155 [Treponema sp.]|nr:hypothetical protein [Treponema sp.]
MRQKATFVFAALVLAAAFAGCSLFSSDDSPAFIPQVTSIKFSTTKLVVPCGGANHFDYTVQPSSLQNKSAVSWAYDESVVRIDPDNYGVVVYGLKKGQTYLKGTVNGITATCLVSVEGGDDYFSGEPYIYSNTSVLELTPGSSQTVSASLYGGSETDLEAMRWEIGDPSVADISFARGSCVVSARRVGSTILTARHDKAAFPYSVVVFCYTDSFHEPYITTSQNIVVINKAEKPSGVSVAFEIKNPVKENWQTGFAYSVADDATDPCFSMNANGNTAMIVPLKNGLSKLVVKHESCQWPLEVLVKVTTAVENTYITASPTTLVIKGSDTAQHVNAKVEGTDRVVDDDGWSWRVCDLSGNPLSDAERDEYMEFSWGGGQCAVRGKKNGAFKIEVSHSICEYKKKILLLLSEQAGSAIDASMYITTAKNYVLTQVGADATAVDVQLMGGNPGDESEFTWTLANGAENEVCKVTTTTGRVLAGVSASVSAFSSVSSGTVIIEPRKMGKATISVGHPRVLYSTDIKVDVKSEYALLETPVYIATAKPYLKLLNGASETVSADLSGGNVQGDENGVRWESDDPSKASVSPPSGQSTAVTATGTGTYQTYVSASHPKGIAPKRMLVLSAASQTELDAMKGFYCDDSYIRVNEKAEKAVELKPIGLEDSDVSRISWRVKNRDGSSSASVCEVRADPQNRLKAYVTGVKAGYSAVVASLDGCADCEIQVTVCPEGESCDVIVPAYLTTTTNAVVIPKVGGKAELSVTGVGISAADMQSTSWSHDGSQASEIFSISGNGRGAKVEVEALKEGRGRAKVENSESENELFIDVKVGALYEWTDGYWCYITSESDTVAMVKGGSKTIGVRLENHSGLQTGFSASVDKPGIAEAACSSNGTIIIDAKEAGMAMLTVTNPNAVAEKEILVAVANTPEELAGLQYLTTKQNVVTIGESSNATVAVDVKNGSGVVSGFTWTTDNPSVLEVVGGGKSAVFYGKRAGTAKVTVKNDQCLYPLEIIANVVDPVKAAQNPYIACRNILTLHVGDDPETLSAQLVGGTDADNANFQWHSENPEVAAVWSANEAATVRPVSEGVTQLVISHPKANGIDRTVLVIVEPKVETECYITVSESIIKMSPGDGSKSVKAELVGGTAADAHNFKWWADSYEILDMHCADENCVITPARTGTTTIHCSHPKAPYAKDIVLYVSQYSEFAFAETNVSLTQGKQGFASLQVPTLNVSTKVSYSVADAFTGQASGGLSASGTLSVCVLDPREAGDYVVTARLLASNSGQEMGKATLMCHVEKSKESETYINFTGSTIITVEKGETLTLAASVIGPQYATGDERSIKWFSSDPNAAKLSPASASGFVTNDTCKLTGVTAGTEATITLTHEKCAPLTLYVLVPGENVANILLDRQSVNLTTGDGPFTLSADITNAAEDDYKNLEWTIEQDEQNPVLKKAGSGKAVSLTPLAEGTATVVATVPSSLRSAKCAVTITKPRSISFNYKKLSGHPGQSFELKYTVSPESETGSVKWTVGDQSVLSISDDKKGTLTCVLKERESAEGVLLKGTTDSGASCSINVTNGWNETLRLSKTAIKTVPVFRDDGTFDVSYTVSPASAVLKLANLGQRTTLAAGTYTSYTADGGGVYDIGPIPGDDVDLESDTRTGTITFVPSAETKTRVLVTVYNPESVNGKVRGMVPDLQKAVDLDVYYTDYDWKIDGFQVVSGGRRSFVGYENNDYTKPVYKTETFSALDEKTGVMTIGDGEKITFSPSPAVKGACPAQIMEVKVNFKASNSTSLTKPTDSSGQRCDQFKAAAYYSNLTSTLSSSGGSVTGGVTVQMCADYNSSAPVWNGAAALYPTDALIEHLYGGTIDIKYTTVFGGTKTHSIPFYIDIRY